MKDKPVVPGTFVIRTRALERAARKDALRLTGHDDGHHVEMCLRNIVKNGGLREGFTLAWELMPEGVREDLTELIDLTSVEDRKELRRSNRVVGRRTNARAGLAGMKELHLLLGQAGTRRDAGRLDHDWHGVGQWKNQVKKRPG